MAKAREVAQAVSATTGVRLEAVQHVCRKLGEADLGPPRRRGINAPDYEAVHLARVIVGVMLLGDGIGQPAVRVAQRVEALGRGDMQLSMSVTGQGDDAMTWLVAGGPFVRNVAELIGEIGNRLRAGETIELEKYPAAIGITFRGDDIQGWMELSVKANLPHGISEHRRVPFGPPIISTVALAREVRVEIGALVALGKFLPGEHKGFRDQLRSFFEAHEIKPSQSGSETDRKQL